MLPKSRHSNTQTVANATRKSRVFGLMPAALKVFRTHPLVAELLTKCTFAPSNNSIHCAVSGGADSVALLVLAAAHCTDVTAWHVDHGLRDGSATEAQIVDDIAIALGAKFESRTVVVEMGSNLEARAREARFAVLPTDVTTGHTADDQAETVLVNLLRGAGMRGLSGMQRGPSHPILQLRRSDTVALCNALGIAVFHDPSNDDDRFQRNRIRHEVLPLLQSISQRDVVSVIARQAELVRDDDALLDELASAIDPTDAKAIAAAPQALARRALRMWLAHPYPPDLATVERVLCVARGETPGCDIGGGRQVKRSQQRLKIIALF
jgi:tRNA(Ile)-lysidine synthase